MSRALLFLLATLLAATPALAQLEACYEAHGGLEKWRAEGRVRFDLVWKSKKGEMKDTHLFDLHSRRGVITAEAYQLGVGADGEVWVTPTPEALGGRPPRFYLWTPFYFFAMPFVFADPGAKHESLGRKTFRGEECDAVKVTFEKGVGDTPDDYYVAYIDAKTHRLQLVYYIVTYASLRQGKPLAELGEHALVFEEWQPADELLVPMRAAIFDWKDGATQGEPLGTLEFSHVDYSPARPAVEMFAKPDGAVIDQSHEAVGAK